MIRLALFLAFLNSAALADRVMNYKKVLISPNGIKLIGALEGVRNCVYEDVTGHRTIGIGHLIKPGEKFTCISDEEIKELFKKDLRRFMKAVSEVPVHLNQAQKDALLSFAFNIGVGGFKSSETFRQLRAGRYQEAAQSMLNWSFSKGRFIPGLRLRRIVEAQIFLGKETQRLSEAAKRLPKAYQQRIKKLVDNYYQK